MRSKMIALGVWTLPTFFLFGCAGNPPYLAPESLSTFSSAEIVVLSPPQGIHIQSMGSEAVPMLAGSLIFEAALAAKRSEAKKKEESISGPLDGTKNQLAINASLKDNLQKISWVHVKTVSFQENIEEFNIARAVEDSSANLLLVISPVIDFPPTMGFVETAATIEFFVVTQKGQDTYKPFYSITAVSQSERYVRPDNDPGRSFYRPLDHVNYVKSATQFWSRGDGLPLQETIYGQIAELGRVVLAAIEDASNLNAGDRVEGVTVFQDVSGMHSDTKIKSYSLANFETNDRIIVRVKPADLSGSDGVPNVIYSVPKGAPVLSFFGRH